MSKRCHCLLVRILIISILFNMGYMSGAWAPVGASRAASKTVGFQLLRSDPQGVLFEFHAPPLEIEQVNLNGQAYQRPRLSGYGFRTKSGEPELPQGGTLLAIPPGAELRLSVLETQSEVMDGWRVPPVSHREVVPPGPGQDPLMSPQAFRLQYLEDAAIYAQNAFFPPSLAALGDLVRLRDQQCVFVYVNPAQYNPVTAQIRYHRYLRLLVEFTYPRGQYIPSPGRQESPTFEAVLQNALLNYASSQKWRNPPSQETALDGQLTHYLSSPVYKITIAQDGIYRLTYEYLRDAGLPVDSLDPRTFRMYNRGQELALHVRGQEDGRFGTTDYILFYGQKENSKYTDANIYWLTFGQGIGLRMAERDGTPSGAGDVPDSFRKTYILESNLIYYSSFQGTDELERWGWDPVIAYKSPRSSSYFAALNRVSSGSHTATLEASLYGAITLSSVNPDHHVRLYVNGHQVAEAWWDGMTAKLVSANFPQSYLVNGSNEIRLELPLDTGGPFDAVTADWFKIHYLSIYQAENGILFFSGDAAGTWEYRVSSFSTNDLLAFDITDSLHPTRIINWIADPSGSFTFRFEDTIAAPAKYVALAVNRCLTPAGITLDSPSDLHNTANRADYIIIAHRSLWSEAQTLAQYRQQSSGLRTLLVDVQDVYDEFNYGILHPQPIRDFLRYAYNNWQSPAPSYVVLFGDGTYDFKNYSGANAPNYIPPFLAYADPYIGETAVDERYACVSGDDVLADMHLGRLPVNAGTGEAQAMLDKIQAYEQGPASGSWVSKLLFVADNADRGGPFEAFSDALIGDYVKPPYSADTAYVRDFSSGAACRAAIINAINDGRLLVNYIGHGAINLWASEKILRTDDVPSLSNSGKWPVMLPMTCADGYFIHPSIHSLSESLVRAQDKGAIASWAPAGYGVISGHDYLNRGFLDAVLQEGERTLGLATMAGKLYLFQNVHPSDYYHLETFITLGDPALRLPNQIPVGDRVNPNAGQGLVNVTQLFAATYLDGNGWRDIRNAYFLINTTTDTNSGMYARYDRETGKLYLWGASVGQWLGGYSPGEAQTIATANAILDVAQCTTSGITNVLTMTWAVKFKSSMSGVTHNQYLNVEDKAGASSGWRQVGTWHVNRAPTLGIVSPKSGQSAPGILKIFQAVYRDADGFNDLNNVYFLMNTTASPINACYARYDQVNNLLHLANDGGAFGVGVAPGTPNVILSNSYAELVAGQCQVTRSGTSLTVHWAIRFKEAFSGKQYKQYLRADDRWGASSGFQSKGTWTVNRPPTVGPTLPDSGYAGPWRIQYFTATYTDPDGWQNLAEACFLINHDTNAAYGVYARYERSSGLLYLRNDQDTAWLGGYAPGSAAAIENGQAILDVAQTTVSGSGTNLQIRWALRFKPAFIGWQRNEYLKATDKHGASSGWVLVGVWKVR